MLNQMKKNLFHFIQKSVHKLFGFRYILNFTWKREPDWIFFVKPIQELLISRNFWWQYPIFQLVTGMRTPRVLEELAKNTYQGRNGGFFNGGRYKNGLNEGYDGTGPGFRIRYSQLENCFDGSFILTWFWQLMVTAVHVWFQQKCVQKKKK